MALVISYTSAQRYALFDVKPLDSVFSKPQDTVEQLPHGKPPHITNPQVSSPTPTQYLALTHETLRHHEAIYQPRYHEEIPAVPAYHNKSRLDHFTDDTESSAQSSLSTLPMQMTPMERFEDTAPSNLPHNLYQGYHHFNSPYRGTTRPSVVAATQVAQSMPPHLCVLSSLHTEAGSTDDYRLADDGQGHLSSPFIRIYGLHYGEASYTLTDIGAQFECGSSRDGRTK